MKAESSISQLAQRMNKMTALIDMKISKRQIADAVQFAMNTLPQLDTDTLEKFLRLVNVGGTHGSLSADALLRKMRLALRYVPNACPQSLLVLAELLELDLPLLEQPLLPPPRLEKYLMNLATEPSQIWFEQR